MIKIAYDTAFLSALLLAFAMQLPATIAAAYLLCAGYVVAAYDRSVVTNNQLLLYAAAAVPCLLAVLNFKHGLTSAVYLLALPLVLIAAQLFGSKPLAHINACLRNFFWLFVGGIAFGLALHWGEPEPLGAIFPNSSTNGLPSYLIVVQIAFSLAHYLKYGRLPLLSACATMVVAIFGLGRGSMITAALILLFSLLTNVTIARSKPDRKMLRISAWLLVPPAGLYLLYNFNEILAALQLAIEASKFSGGVLDEHRGRIVSDYLGKIDAWTLMFGTDYVGTSINQHYGGNPHNSFIRAHSFYGVAALIFILIPLVLALLSRHRTSHKFVAVTMIVFALLRATTEPIFFPSTLDFFYFLYFILYFNFAQKRHQPQGQHA
ncbi:MAG: hypothetical protein WKG03_03175 [Telluria sp.]